MNRVWQWLSSVRARVALMATAVVGVALIVAGFLLVRFQREALTDNVDATIRLRAADVAGVLQTSGVPEVVTVSDDEIALVQVLDAGGELVAASPNIRGLPPISEERPSPGHSVIREVDELPIEDEPFRVLTRAVDTPSGTYTVVVAGSLEDVSESIEELVGLLRLGLPPVLLLVAGGAWFAVGRALSPVESIRREVATIDRRDLSRRVPEPRRQDEVGRLAHTMNEMLARLETAYARQDQFVADAAHELRSPLAAMRAQVEVDLPPLLQGERASVLEDLQAELLRMQRLSDDLLLLARGDVQPPGATLVDLDDIVLDEARRARSGRCLVDASRVSAAAVRGDPEQLRRVVRNIVENAVRHATSRVEISLIEEAEGACLTVSDDGSGIPSEARERIFERFTRLDSGRARHEGGAGLGLAIARTIVERHGGSIAVDQTHTPGARFVVRLPSPVGRPINSA